MDSLNAVKLVAVISSGAFGVLGLLKDFKDKETHKVTRWGYISLAGILISTTLGEASQQIEESKAEAARLKTELETRESTEKTLKIVTTTAATLRDVKRSLFSLDGASFSLEIPLRCDSVTNKALCGADWTKEHLLTDVLIYKSLPDTPYFQLPPEANADVDFTAKSGGHNIWVAPDGSDGTVVKLSLDVESKLEEIRRNNGQLRGKSDLSNAVFVLGEIYTTLPLGSKRLGNRGDYELGPVLYGTNFHPRVVKIILADGEVIQSSDCVSKQDQSKHVAFHHLCKMPEMRESLQ